MRFADVRRSLALLIATAVAVPALAQSPAAPSAAAPAAREEFKNLKVLPKDIPPAELRKLMNSFTRALGVRCIHCHVGEEGKPFRHEDFPLDDKPTKLKAREMMKMVKDINEKYLAALDHRAEPAIRVECVTCHRGSPQPRMLQDVLQAAYADGGLDSTVARYHALRERYYGSFTYDFGEVPLADLARRLREAGHPRDAVQLHSFNVEMNPASLFAKRQHAGISIFQAFRDANAESGRAVVRSMKLLYGPAVVTEGMLIGVGYDLLGTGAVQPALAAFELNAAENPQSTNAYDSLGEGYLASGDRKRAKEAYAKALQLDPANADAKQKLEEIRHAPKGHAHGGR